MVNIVRSLYFTFYCNHQWLLCSFTTLSVLKSMIIVLQAHQELSRSYKEICAPVIERCHFLFHELRPACGDEVHSLTRSRLLQSNTRWNCVVSSLIEQIKLSKKGTSHILTMILLFRYVILAIFYTSSKDKYKINKLLHVDPKSKRPYCMYRI